MENQEVHGHDFYFSAESLEMEARIARLNNQPFFLTYIDGKQYTHRVISGKKLNWPDAKLIFVNVTNAKISNGRLTEKQVNPSNVLFPIEFERQQNREAQERIEQSCFC